MIISKLHRMIFQYLCKRAARQGFYHEYNIIYLYGQIVKAARKEFSEDNKYTLDSFLKECHDKALERF